MELGHSVFAITEGKASTVFRNHGVGPSIQTPEVSGFCTINWRKLFSDFVPDWVITGLSVPIHLEEDAGLAANAHGVKLAVIEDVHGASKRTPAHPNLIVTLDDIGVAESKKHHPKAHTLIGGNIGVKKVIPSNEMSTRMVQLRTQFDEVFIFTESGKPGDPAVDEQIQLLIECAQMTKGNFCIIPRLHPKWAKVEEGGTTLHVRWMDALRAGLGAGLVELSGGSTDELVVLANGTISVFSTLLTTAVANGRTAISLRTPASVRLMEEFTGFTTTPLVQLGCAVGVEKPCDLSLFAPLENDEKLQPFDPRGIATILGM